jgi:hypothetical protein
VNEVLSFQPGNGGRKERVSNQRLAPPPGGVDEAKGETRRNRSHKPRAAVLYGVIATTTKNKIYSKLRMWGRGVPNLYMHHRLHSLASNRLPPEVAQGRPLYKDCTCSASPGVEVGIQITGLPRPASSFSEFCVFHRTARTGSRSLGTYEHSRQEVSEGMA